MAALLPDLRHAWRLLVRSRATTAVVVLTLGLGIGANVSLYSIARAVLSKPLPFPAGERLMLVWQSPTAARRAQLPVSGPDYLELRRQARSFAGLEAFSFAPVGLTGLGEPTSLQGLRVTPGLLPLLGTRAQRGRLPASGEPGPPEAGVVLSHRLWQRLFQSDERVLGRTLVLDGRPYSVIGILPPDFQFPPPITVSGQSLGIEGGAEIFLPLDVARLDPQRRTLLVVGILAPGASPAAANEELKVIARRLARVRPPDSSPELTAYTVSLREQAVEEVRTLLIVLFFAAGLVLLVICANVANILLARATERGRELSVRIALGASRLRLFRQLLTESLLLGLGGAGLGAALAYGLARLLAAARIESLPSLAEVRVDTAALGFSLLLALLASVLSGLAPALFALRSTSNRGAAGASSTLAVPAVGRFPVQRILVVFELALAIILLSAVGLMLRSLWSLQRASLSVDPELVQTAILDLPADRYAEPFRKVQAVEAMAAALRAQPEILAAGAVSALPFSALMDGIRFKVEAGGAAAPGEPQVATKQVITPGYLEAMGIRVVEGRGFSQSDQRSAPPVALVSQSLARRQWPKGSAVGQRIALGKDDIAASRWTTIAGVIQDMRLQGRTSEAPPVIYQPAGQVDLTTMTLVARVRESAAGPAAVRRAIWTVDPQLPVEVRTMRERLDDVAMQPRVGSWVLGLFAAVALTLGALGIYGIISCNVAARRREIAIRMALGARKQEITTLFLRSTLKMIVFGLLLGVGGALALGRLLASLLFGLSSGAPSELLLIAAFLCLIGAASTYLPVRLALRRDIAAELRAS